MPVTVQICTQSVRKLARMTKASFLLHLLQDLASSDHTTLLLNCYAKLRDTAKLDRFLRAEGPDGKPALSFDVDTAIKARLYPGVAVISQHVLDSAGWKACN